MNVWKKIIQLKKHNKTGVPIYKNPCYVCPFCIMPGRGENRFPVCNSPYVYKDVYVTSNLIIKCPDKKEECLGYVSMSKSKKDFVLIKKYIRKFYIDGYIAIKNSHINFLIKRIKYHDEYYLKGLFKFYGFYYVTDKKIDKKYKILFCNLIDKLRNE